MGSHTDRIVVLVDMDCFYCQVEEKLDPSLVGKPIAVVQYNAWKGGGLIAVNYPARDQGVTRHMRGDEAKEKCPDIVLVKVPCVRGKADLTKYREGGKRVAEVLQTFTPLLQRASIDEAYLDITEAVENRLKNLDRQITRQDVPNTHVVAWDSTEAYIENIYKNDFNNEHNLKLLIGGVIVEKIRAAVYEKTGYRCSAGVAHNKILAKLSCGIHKPNKQTLLPHESVDEMYKTLPIKKIKGLGAKFGNSLAEDLQIKYMSELAKFSEKELLRRYDDKTANFLYNIARGINLEPVEVRLVSKSIGCCKRFPGKNALLSSEDVTHWLSELAEELSERLEQDIQENNRRAKQMVLSFAQEVNKKDIHSSRTISLNSYEAKKITEDAFETLKRFAQKSDGSFVIKFLGLSAGKFDDKKNVNDITSFFKNAPKSDNILLESQSSFNLQNNSCKNLKNTKDLTSLLKNMNRKQETQHGVHETQDGALENHSKGLQDGAHQNDNSGEENITNFIKNGDLKDLLGQNGNSEDDSNAQKLEMCNKIGNSKMITSFLQNMQKSKKNKVNSNDFKSKLVENEQNDTKKNILNYFDKTVDSSQNFKSKTHTPKHKNHKKSSTITNFFQESQLKDPPKDLNESSSISNKYQTIFGKENFLNLSNIDEALNLSDIENDVQNSDPEVSTILMNGSVLEEDHFSDSTIEDDYTDVLAKKEEFPFRSKQNLECIGQKREEVAPKPNNSWSNGQKSPVLGNRILQTSNGTGNSFFMRYLQKREGKTPTNVETGADRSSSCQIEHFDTNSSDSCQSDKLEVKNDIIESVECCSSAKLDNRGVTSAREAIRNDNFDSSSSDSCQNEVSGALKTEPMPGSSKDMSERCQSDILLPVEAVYSQNSSNFDGSMEICSECGENIAKHLLISHMDHHFALKLMDEEKKLFKKELELFNQRKQNKSPTVKELIHSRLKNKGTKRKQSDKNKNITSFFTQKTENEISENTDICPECNKNVLKSDFSSHLDFHAAKKLHLELNPVKVVSNNQFKVNNKKNSTNKIIVNSNNSSLTNFFKPK